METSFHFFRDLPSEIFIESITPHLGGKDLAVLEKIDKATKQLLDSKGYTSPYHVLAKRDFPEEFEKKRPLAGKQLYIALYQESILIAKIEALHNEIMELPASPRSLFILEDGSISKLKPNLEKDIKKIEKERQLLSILDKIEASITESSIILPIAFAGRQANSERKLEDYYLDRLQETRASNPAIPTDPQDRKRFQEKQILRCINEAVVEITKIIDSKNKEKDASSVRFKKFLKNRCQIL